MNGKVMERPQHMIMRVAIGIHKGDIDAAIETYNLMCVPGFGFVGVGMYARE